MVEARAFSSGARAGHTSRSGSALVHVSGMGAGRAARAAALLADSGCSALVSFGTAGALVPRLASGDLVITADVRASGPAAACEPRAADALRAALDADVGGGDGIRLLAGACLAHSDSTLERQDARRVLAERTGAVAVDLESLAIAKVAFDRGLPFLAVRSIVDTLESALPEGLDRHIDAFGRPRWSLGPWLVARPARISGVLGLARRMTRAGHSLRACARVLRGLAGEPS